MPLVPTVILVIITIILFGVGFRTAKRYDREYPILTHFTHRRMFWIVLPDLVAGIL